MNAAHIVKILGGRGNKAPCPAHGGLDHNLSIHDGVDGQILVKCWSKGCSYEQIKAVLRDRGAWPERPARLDELGPIVATYDYHDARGELLYQVVRHEPKTFRPRYPDGRGGWIKKKHPTQVLYRLGEVLEAPIVFLVEGEKDVESLRSHGFTATTAAGGADARWLPTFTETLRGREVIIVPDNDAPGWKRAKTIARALLGNADRIIVFDLPRDCKDITDWFAAGHTEVELIAQLESVVHAG